MKRHLIWGLPALILLAVLFALAPSFLRASDHADPMALKEPESNITDLFFFPKDDQLIVILNIRRALRNPKPYNLYPFEYAVHMDLTSPVTFENEADRGHYGGTIVAPERLRPDVSIRIKLNDDTTLKSISTSGLKVPDERIRVFTGVRDDPFVFPRFFQRNIIAMVMSVPMAAFPEGQRDWIIWGRHTRRANKSITLAARTAPSKLASMP